MKDLINSVMQATKKYTALDFALLKICLVAHWDTIGRILHRVTRQIYPDRVGSRSNFLCMDYV